MSSFRTKLSQILVRAAWGVMVSLPFFAPIPFYYTLYFGVGVPWLVIGGEESIPGDFKWGQYDLHFYPKVFLADMLLWLIGLLVTSKFVKYIESKSFLSW